MTDQNKSSPRALVQSLLTAFDEIATTLDSYRDEITDFAEAEANAAAMGVYALVKAKLEAGVFGQ